MNDIHKEEDMKRFVVGFLMDPLHEYGLLIRKTHPDWQAGKLNGVGGAVEYGETDFEAIAREFEEETGLEIDESDWDRFYEVTYENAVVVFFRANGPMSYLADAATTTEEQIGIWHLKNALKYETLIPNLHYILPMAMHGDNGLKASGTVPR